MKALFALRNVVTNKRLKEPTFENKLEAKKHRDKLWEEAGKPMTKTEVPEESKPIFPFVVTYGPHHDKFIDS